MDNDVLHKEIDLIQGVINRMANNSFLLKGWLISLIAVVLALSKDSLLTNDLTYLSLILCLPVIAFWYLDAFFLHKERCYRKLYSWVIENRKNTDEHLYSLDFTRFKSEVNSPLSIMFSSTLITFYGLVVAILIGVTIYNHI
ncbi:hypothetical protein L3073_02065 [Ancylomarina sp. DW003]|nr:hypothetical protein [Ancylomarina sp. DW003]MDE5420987.1 hypothetical protein [Ancylomarina sp. DW003]